MCYLEKNILFLVTSKLLEALGQRIFSVFIFVSHEETGYCHGQLSFDCHWCIVGAAAIIGPSGVLTKFREQSIQVISKLDEVQGVCLIWSYKIMPFIIHSVNCTTQGVFCELLLNEKVCSAFHKFQLKTVGNIVIA